MRYIKNYQQFSINETLGDLLTLPVDPIPQSLQVMKDVWQVTAEWLSSFKQTIIRLFNQVKHLLPKLWEIICLVSKDEWNRICQFVFEKDYSDCSINDVNTENVRKLSNRISKSITDFFTDNSWSFKNDVDKINEDPESAINDKSLRLVTAINKSLTSLFKFITIPYFTATLTSIVSPLLGSAIESLNIPVSDSTISIICGTILSVSVATLLIWLKNKQFVFEVKLAKDLRDIPGYEDRNLLTNLGTKAINLSREVIIKDYTPLISADKKLREVIKEQIRKATDLNSPENRDPAKVLGGEFIGDTTRKELLKIISSGGL